MTTLEKDTTAPAEETLEEYKAKVRDEAFRVAKQQSWCDDGLNQTLRTLGLPEKKTYRTVVEVMTKQYVTISNKDVLSQEEADAAALEPAVLARQVGGNVRVDSARVFVHEEGTLYEKGEPDPSDHQGSYRNMCRRMHESGYECTLPRVKLAARDNLVQHVVVDGVIQHLTGNGGSVYMVWTENLAEVPIRTIEERGMMTNEDREAEQKRRDEAAQATTESLLAD